MKYGRRLRRYRVREMIRALLNLPVLVPVSRAEVMKETAVRGVNGFGLEERDAVRGVYRVWIRPGKEVLVDTSDMTFMAPRWGYTKWTPIARHPGFFGDVYESGADLPPGQQQGARRRTIGEYQEWRASGACRYDDGRPR